MKTTHTWRERESAQQEYMRVWRKAHATQIKEYRRQWYADHRTETIASAIAWQHEHVVEHAIHRKVAAANQRYEGRICAQDIRDLIDRDGWDCHWCKKPITALRDFTLEHLAPVNDPAVLAIACRACNAAKLHRLGLTARLDRKAYLARRIDKKRIYDDRWRREHREQSNASQRARYYAHLDERRVYFREWQRKKRERDAALRRVPPVVPAIGSDRDRD